MLKLNQLSEMVMVMEMEMEMEMEMGWERSWAAARQGVKFWGSITAR